MTSVQAKQPDHQASSEDTAYFAHKMSKQVFHRGLLGVAFGHRAASYFQTYTALYQGNRRDAVFADRSATIYKGETRLSRVMRKTFLPIGFRRQPLTKPQQTQLNSHGMKHMGRFSNYLFVATLGRAAGNAWAWNQEGSQQSDAVIGLELAQTTAWLTFMLSLKRATKLKRQENTETGTTFPRSYAAFMNMRRLAVGANLLQAVTGAVKMGYEAKDYSDGKKQASLAALTDGVLDIGHAISDLAYQSFLISKAKQFTKAGKITEAVDVASLAKHPIPSRLLWAMRGFNMTSAGIALFYNLHSIIDGINFQDPHADIEGNKIISGSLGGLSAAFMMAYGYFLTPAAIPLGSLFFATGMGFLILQTLYDEMAG